ncbi:MAG: hypothetical protein L6W00_22755 [Lentisphaeria bacterium]|nr:MAG: hypothetical protein L6W00_22755 [Lentisphaeria bacterium]
MPPSKRADSAPPYGRRHVTFEELPEFVRFARESLAGVNLTVPHKAAVIPLIDRVDPEAAAAGSVNTLVIENGEIFGTSTDGYGLEHALLANFHRPVRGAAFCFVGAGGAAHATAFHLAGCGARAIRLANRTVAKAEARRPAPPAQSGTARGDRRNRRHRTARAVVFRHRFSDSGDQSRPASGRPVPPSRSNCCIAG